MRISIGRWRGLSLTSVLLVLLALTPIACNKQEASAPAATTQTQAKGELVIEDNALGAWITLNNTFALPPLNTRDQNKHYGWAGVLLQIGDFPALPNTQPPRFQFEKLYFSKGDSVVGAPLERGSYANKQFWVNIVAQRSDYEAPMQPTNVALLCPWPSRSYCTAPAGVDPRCLRDGKIHGGMDPVLGIVTYWQGTQGFELKAVQPSPELGSSYTFKLLDDFAIDVYTVENDGTATQDTTYAAGTVDRITVAKRVFGPSDGDKQDPPWPGGK